MVTADSNLTCLMMEMARKSILLLVLLVLTDYTCHGAFRRPASHILVKRGGNIDKEGKGSILTEDEEPSSFESGQSNDAATPRRPFLWSSTVSSISSRAKAGLEDKLEAMRRHQPKLRIGDWKQTSSKVVSAIGPAAVAIGEIFWKEGVTLPALYALALLGSSCGFYLFLYFITVGYAMGVTIPLLVAFVVYNLKTGHVVSFESNIHTTTTILWGVRSTVFLLYREYINWPQLHQKVVEVNRIAKLSSKIFCWLVYSLFYVALALPCWCRLHFGTEWKLPGRLALVLQSLGLLLETVADHQKSAFKVQPGQRTQWCNEGLWSWSTHPNYLGEWLFWFGTYFAGIATYKQSPLPWLLATVGLVFVSVVLRGAALSLAAKQERKYGENPAFVHFRNTHSIVGPIPTMFQQVQQNNSTIVDATTPETVQMQT